MKRRSKRRNFLTTDSEIAELAYACHINAKRLQLTATAINITAAFRMELLRLAQRHINVAIKLGYELDTPDPEVFITKESAEKFAEALGIFN
jgi:integrase